MNFANISADAVVKGLVNLYAKSPILMSVVMILLNVTLGAGIYFAYKIDKENQEKDRLINQDYHAQLQQLNATERNIKQLLQFVDSQRKALSVTQDAISLLRVEQEKLKPLVESDRAVIDALFRAQESRNDSNVWRERLIGFGFGLLASILTSILGHLAKEIWNRRANCR